MPPAKREIRNSNIEIRNLLEPPGHAAYPDTPAARDRWILEQRPPRHAVDPRLPQAFLLEPECSAGGQLVEVATVFLTNRECPWRCLMCDLWRHTIPEDTPPGAIPAQIAHALEHLGLAGASARPARGNGPRQIKLYNSGSFFDRRAVPPADLPAIARQVRAFTRVIVECHPALVGRSAVAFNQMLAGEPDPAADPSSGTAQLEVAMGLETVEPVVLEKLNKRMTLGQFARAAEFLRANGIALRVFVLVKPPFLDESAALHWAQRSIDFAFACGAGVVSLIPTRLGNGALEMLTARGGFSPPQLATLETALEYGLGLKRGRVFADLWDLEKFSTCRECYGARHDRLQKMNWSQEILAPIACPACS